MKRWSESFPLRGNLNQFFELLGFVASQDEVTRDDCFRFSSLRASDLLYAVNGIDNILDFFVFVGLTNKVDDAYVPESATLGPLLEEKNDSQRNLLFIHHVASSMRQDFEVWTRFLRQLRTNNSSQIALPNTGDYCLLRDVLISCQLVTFENNQWIGLENVEVIREDFQKLLQYDRDRLKFMKVVSPMQLKVQQEKQQAIGALGELVWEYLENERLLRIGHSKKCDVVANRNCAAGFDIQSYSDINSFCFNTFYEVKSTSFLGDAFDFHLSFNEFNTATALEERYSLVLIWLDLDQISFYSLSNPNIELGLTHEMWKPIGNGSFDSIHISIEATLFAEKAEVVKVDSIQDDQLRSALVELRQSVKPNR